MASELDLRPDNDTMIIREDKNFSDDAGYYSDIFLRSHPWQRLGGPSPSALTRV
jgi:hypothetical protein